MTPLVVLCGFLGAGKTTFLRALAGDLAGRRVRPHIVINDYQNAAVDAALLGGLAEVVEPVSGSCVCCGSREELVGVLAAVAPRPGQVVLVEANGTTDTEAMLEIFGGAAELSHLSPPLQLTVVDGERYGQRDWRNELERVQVRTATHLFLSRQDLISAERASSVRAAASGIAPRAEWTTPEQFGEALCEALRIFDGHTDRAGWLAAVSRGGGKDTGARPQPVSPTPSGPNERRGASHVHFASFEVPLSGRMDPEALLGFLRGLPGAVLRAKGIADFAAPIGDRRSFQLVEGTASISDCTLFEPETLATSAVFIGVGLPVAEVTAGLRALCQPA